MSHLRAFGRRIGRLPSALVIGGSYVAIVGLAALTPRSAADPVSFAMLALVAAYCLLRRTRRGEVFGAWLAPSAVSLIAHDLTGVPRWILALPVALLVVAMLIGDDREERRDRAAATPAG